MRASNRRVLLLLANLIALPLLVSPSLGFIGYMNRTGVAEFIVVGWFLAACLAALLWRRVPSKRGPAGYGLALVAAFVPVVFAWAIALRSLYWPEEPDSLELWRWVGDVIILGGLFTSGYWLPASILNYVVLRRRAA